MSSMAVRRTAGVAWVAAVLAACALLMFPRDVSAQVYRWVDDQGVVHLSSEKPPPGVKAERIDIGSSKNSSKASSARRTGSAATATAPASPQQVAQREELLGRLRTRECVIALETLERKTSGTEPTSAAELRRLQQTVDANCSQDPTRRLQQEQMAAKLRVANGPSCVEARNRLADMMAPESKATRQQVQSQQAFVDEHCTSPVR
jgi:hypothetical protein